MEQKCGLQESPAEDKEHKVQKKQSEGKIQPEKMEIIMINTQKLLRYLKQEIIIEKDIHWVLTQLNNEIKKQQKDHGFMVFLLEKMLSDMRKQTTLTLKLFEWYHKMMMPTSTLISLRSDADLLDIDNMLYSSESVKNFSIFILIVDNLLKSQEEYYEVKKRFVDQYYDKIKDEAERYNKEQSPDSSQQRDEIIELKSAIDNSNQEVQKSVKHWNKVKMRVQKKLPKKSETEKAIPHLYMGPFSGVPFPGVPFPGLLLPVSPLHVPVSPLHVPHGVRPSSLYSLPLQNKLQQIAPPPQTETEVLLLLTKEPTSSSSSLPPQIQIPQSPQTKTQSLESLSTESQSEQKYKNK